MVGSGHVDKGAIYSVAGDSKWAGSAGFEVRLTTSCYLHTWHMEPSLQNLCGTYMWRESRNGDNSLTTF
jgi:hypothetical protein